jgi:hypothetical protein
MTWLYEQITGKLTNTAIPDFHAVGYSGHGDGCNNPDCETQKNVGPIPRGVWLIKAPYESKRTGRHTIPLEMFDGDVFGRDGFRIHGDNSKGDQSASHGCIILPYAIRIMITQRAAVDGDDILIVS